MLLTTLVPTLVRLAIASSAAVLWLGQTRRLLAWRRDWAARLDGDASARLHGALFLWAAGWIGILAPLLLLWLAWLWASTLCDLHLLDHLLGWLRVLATWIDPCMPPMPMT